MSNLGKKRLEAVLAIATYSIGNGTASAAPTPGIEIPKQIVLTASDVAMYTTIWKIYFHDDLSSKGILEMLAELGLVTLAATGTAYIVGKTTTAITSEIADWLGPVGWGVTVVIATSITGLFAASWAVYCDRLYSESPESIALIRLSCERQTYRTYALYKLIMVCVHENSSFQALINRSLMIHKPAL